MHSSDLHVGVLFYCFMISMFITLLLTDSCSYKLEKEDLRVSELFEMINAAKVEVGIQDWGIKMTTLEDG